MAPWWQSVLGGIGVVLAAIIAGSFAVRNARKTPHETLKTLVEIAEKADGHIQPEDRTVLDVAIHREIERIDRLNQARLRGFWRFFLETVRQHIFSFDALALGVVAPVAGVIDGVSVLIDKVADGIGALASFLSNRAISKRAEGESERRPE